MRVNDRGFVLVCLGAAVLLVSGVVVLLTSPQPTEFLWFAYATSSDRELAPGFVLTPRRVLGTGLVVLSVVVVVAAVAYRLGRRTRPAVGD